MRDTYSYLALARAIEEMNNDSEKTTNDYSFKKHKEDDTIVFSVNSLSEESTVIYRMKPGKYFPEITVEERGIVRNLVISDPVFEPSILQFIQESNGLSIDVKWNKNVTDIIDEITIPVASMFIIPNSAATAKGYILKPTSVLIDQMMKISESNGVTYDAENDKLIQIWMCNDSTGLTCENLEDHHPFIRDIDGNRYELSFPYHLPENVCRLFKEGQTRELILPNIRVTKLIGGSLKYDELYNSHKLNTTVKMQMTPAQSIYRYRRYGANGDEATWEGMTQYVII